MQIWIVTSPFSTDFLPDELFQRCLLQVDADSQARIRRFFRRQDAWREREKFHKLLPRVLLKEHNVLPGSVVFGRTAAGKPFIESPDFSPAIGYNITHDNDVVAMVSCLGEKPLVDRIGIDVMKRILPKGETVRSFLRAIEDTLTLSEMAIFTPDLDTATAVRYVFMLWTLKEAYTKALGLGLGFDFKRINYNINQNYVLVDGDPPLGWEFLLFVVQVKDSDDIYQGAVVSWVGGEQTKLDFISEVGDDPRFFFKELTQLIDT